MNAVHVRGVGLWTPGHPTPMAWVAGKPNEKALRPSASLLVGPLHRRATPLTRMGVEAMCQAVVMGGGDVATIPSVWATAHGEHSAAIGLLGMMAKGEGRVSPTRFHNSVHNTASGYASIAAGNRAISTTLTGGAELVHSAFVEAFCMLETFASEVVLVLADEPLASPFERADVAVPLAIAFHLASDAEGALARLHDLRRDVGSPVERHATFGALHVSAALPLVERIVAGRPGTVALELEGDGAGRVACLDLEILAPYFESPANASAPFT